MSGAALARRPTAPTRHVYDVIIFGGQLGGALAAGVLAKRGLHVLLVEHDGLGSGYTHGDYTFPHAPFLTGALDKIPAVEAMLSELGVLPQVKRAAHAASVQVLRPRHWFELHAEMGARAKEAVRALGEAGAEPLLHALEETPRTTAASDAYFQAQPDLPPDGWFARWKFRRHLARFSGLDGDTTLTATTPELTMLRSLERFAATADSPLTRARTLGRFFPTPHVFPNGAEGLRTLLTDRARELGVDVLEGDQQIELMVLEGKTAVGIRLRRNETSYRAGALVAACDLLTWGPLIPEARRGPVQKLAALVPSTRALFTTHVVVPESAVPRGLGSLALIESSDTELGTVLAAVTHARKNGHDSATERVVSLTVRAPLGLKAGGEPAVQALAARVWSSVRDVLPFTRKHALVSSSPWADSQRVVAGLVEPWPTFDLPERAPLGVAGLPTSTPWPRLFNASRQVLPGLGLEGEALAAQRAITAVEKLLKKKDPLRAGRPQ